MSSISALKNIHEFTAQLTPKHHNEYLCNSSLYTRKGLAVLWENANKWRRKGVKYIEFDLKNCWNRASLVRQDVVRAFGGQKIAYTMLSALASIPMAMIRCESSDGDYASCVLDLAARELRIRLISHPSGAISREVYAFNELYVPIARQDPIPIEIFLLAAEAISDKKI